MFALSITLITILFHVERYESYQPFLERNRVDCFDKIQFLLHEQCYGSIQGAFFQRMVCWSIRIKYRLLLVKPKMEFIGNLSN